MKSLLFILMLFITAASVPELQQMTGFDVFHSLPADKK